MIVEAQVTINGTKAATWAAITDIDNAAKLITGIEGIEIVERPANGLVGLRWRETRMFSGDPAIVEKRITEVVENESYTTRAEGHGFVFLTTRRISGSDGALTYTEIHDSQPQGFAARLKAIPMSLLFRGMMTKLILQDMNDIKTAAERG